MSGKASWRRYVSYETYRGEISGRGKHKQAGGKRKHGAAATVTREPREEAARGVSRAPGTERRRGSGCLLARGRSAPC